MLSTAHILISIHLRIRHSEAMHLLSSSFLRIPKSSVFHMHMQMSQSREGMCRKAKMLPALTEGQEKAGKSECESGMEAEKRLSQAMMSVTSPLSPSHTYLGLNANAFTIRRCVNTGLLRQKKFLFFLSIISFNSDCSGQPQNGV